MKKNSDIIKEKIIYILDHFPKITPSMLQISLGSSIPTSMWRPALEELIEDEMVYRTTQTVQTPSGRNTTQTILSSEPL